MEDSGLGDWISGIAQIAKTQGLQVQMRRDHFAYLIGMFWDGTAVSDAVEWLRVENCLQVQRLARTR